MDPLPTGSAPIRLTDAVLSEIVASAMDGIITVGADQRIALFNAAAERIFGRTAVEVLGQPLELLLPERFRREHARYIEAFGHASVTKRTMGNLGSIFGLRANGEEFPIEASISQLQVGRAKLFTVILRDISDRRRVEEALHASTTLVQSIVDSSEDAIIGKTLEGVIISWNTGAEKLFGYSALEMLGTPISILIPPDRTDEEPAILARIARGERVQHFETERIRKDGSRICVSVSISPLRDSSGRIVGASKIARDITEHKRAQEKVVRLSRIHAVLSSINSLIVRSRDRQILLDEACKIAVDQGGFGAAGIGLLKAGSSELSMTAWAGPDSDRQHWRAITDKALRDTGLVGRALSEQRPTFSNDIAADPNEPVTQRMRVSLDFGHRSQIALPLLEQGRAIGVIELFAKERDFFDEGELKLLNEIAGDISYALEHIGQEEKLHHLAYHDPLTGLANRVLLQDRLEQAIRSAKQTDTKVALLYGDIKGFREINETWSRQAGDAVLREHATRLRQLSPEPDNIARIGADYFAGLISNFKTVSDVAHLIEHAIAGLLSEPYTIGDRKINVTTRAGIAVFPADGDDAESLFRNAEAAHRSAKAGRRRYQFYQPEMNAKVAETLLLENKLKAALANGEFLLYYQPKVKADDGSLVSVEALLRWKDPERGIVSPSEFIPVLEETGLIIEVGDWIIRQALSDHREWQAAGLTAPRVAVNISSVQLQQGDFIHRVTQLLDAEPRIVDLEITESVLMQHIDDTIEKLKSLRALGVSVAIDDFGTGYSSLSYLARLPISTVKIDRSFVASMTDDAHSMAIVSGVISLARALKLIVVAEGVETEEQARFLRLLGCDELQGFLFSRPLPSSGLVKLFSGPAADQQCA
ncbi:MAG TPA: EAL domain-containing protein [Steroidobacteraceae bacterium]|nr:EAL domain-containing protein [Steroidobacteraceae bacterium]